MMIDLYEFTGAALQLAESLENGEIDEQTYFDTLTAMGAENAIENALRLIANYNAEAEACKAEAARLTDKRRTAETRVENIKAQILRYMNASNQKKVVAGTFTVSRGVTKATKIYDESALPSIYMIQAEPKPDKAAILRALKTGEAIPGAEIVENEHIKIR